MSTPNDSSRSFSRQVPPPKAHSAVRLRREVDGSIGWMEAPPRRQRRFTEGYGGSDRGPGREGVNGIHDVGGMHGFGPVERDEVVFHAEWEKRQCALSMVAIGRQLFNVDESRHSIERIDPVAYLRALYFERWQAGLEMLMVEKGVLSHEEIAARIAQYAGDPVSPLPRPEHLAPFAGMPTSPPKSASPPVPRFAVDDRVVTRNVHPTGHTRLPRYARGKRGRIDRVHGVQSCADTNAHGLGPQPQPLYGVRFEATELWGQSADGRGAVHLDLWESYLEREET
jgi:nitrile hydratase subunit beta